MPIKTTLPRSVLLKYMNPYFLETGTADADCTRLAIDVGFEKVYSIDVNQISQDRNRLDLKEIINSGNVTLITGDSLHELSKLIPSLDKPTTFWLDAHGSYDGFTGAKSCPLYEELQAIKSSEIKTHTIMMDDMRILGGNWGRGIDQGTLKQKCLEINSEYKFTLENGHVPNDILVAYI